MQNKIKVNLGFWLASQFASVVANNRPAILGSLIPNLAIHENLIAPTRTDLHVACEMFLLDLACLDCMSLLGKKEDGVFYSLV